MAFSVCTEPELKHLAAKLSAGLHPGDWVILEGEMGSGKSTFARELIEHGMGAKHSMQFEGSPTFALAHEYPSADENSSWVHVDLYRLKNEAEIEMAGIAEIFWRKNAVVIVEWLSLWPIFEGAVFKEAKRRTKTLDPRNVFQVNLEIGGDANTRRVQIAPFGSSSG